MYGYDYVLSIEHEDSLMSPDEGLTQGSGVSESDRDPGASRGGLVGLEHTRTALLKASVVRR